MKIEIDTGKFGVYFCCWPLLKCNLISRESLKTSLFQDILVCLEQNQNSKYFLSFQNINNQVSILKTKVLWGVLVQKLSKKSRIEVKSVQNFFLPDNLIKSCHFRPFKNCSFYWQARLNSSSNCARFIKQRFFMTWILSSVENWHFRAFFGPFKNNFLTSQSKNSFKIKQFQVFSLVCLATFESLCETNWKWQEDDSVSHLLFN